MASFFTSLLKLTAGIAESGLLIADTAMKSVQSSVETLAGIQRSAPNQPPLDGPIDVDNAVSDLLNRVARIGRFSVMEVNDLPKALGQLIEAFQYSFNYVNWNDPRSLLLPLQIPLSFGTLLTQQGLRGLATLEIVGVERYPKFAANIFEMFTELPVYVGLQYKDIIETLQKRLAESPDDSQARAELGRVLIKCGLYEEAAEHLRQAAEDAKMRPLAMHERAVALYRSGLFREAVTAACQAVSANPSDERARNWLWMCSQKIGGYPDFIPPENRMEAKAGWAAPTVEFEDISARIGLDKTSGGRGTAVFDFNNDGYLDVFVAASMGGCGLYRNNGDGTFTDVSVQSGLDGCVNAFVAAAGDYNNDGYTDLFITRLGFYNGEGELWRNNGDGTFTDVTKESGLNCWGPGFTATWVDYDCDGNLDLFVAFNLGGLFDRKTQNRLFHNNGDGTFTDVTAEAGIRTIWPSIGSTWGDYDNDGYPDLFLSSGMGRSHLFHNNRDGTFTDVSVEAGLNAFGIASVALFCDVDNDGWLDLIQMAWSDHEDMTYTLQHGEGPAGGNASRIFRNNRDGTFKLVSAEYGITECWGTMSGNAGDFNNDGWLDLALGNGSPRMDRLEPLVLLESDGKKYRNITFAAGLPPNGKSHGVNLADLFGDGRLSILVASGGAYPGELITASVWYPKMLPGNYVNVRLTGTRSNRSAIGARLKLEFDGREQHRVINGGTNFGCLPFEQHFGLGQATSIDALEVRWPSGLVQRFSKPPVNRTIAIEEGAGVWRDVYQKNPPAISAEVSVTLPSEPEPSMRERLRAGK